MYDDIKMSPIKNHFRDMKTMFIIVVLISIFIPVLMGMSIQMNKTMLMFVALFLFIVMGLPLFIWFLIHELYIYPNKTYGHALAFKTKKDIEKELEKEEILDECVLYEKDYLDVFGDVIPWKKTRICISDNWIMVETAEKIKNGAKNKGLVCYVRCFFLRSKINKIEIKDNDGPICLQATYSDEFSENIIKYSKSSIDISDVKKACDFLRCRVEDGKTEVNCKPKSRFKKCSICEKFVCQDEKVCPNCGHTFAKYM